MSSGQVLQPQGAILLLQDHGHSLGMIVTCLEIGCRPLTVRIRGVGSFKSFRKFTVWAGVEEEAEGSLQELAARIDKVSPFVSPQTALAHKAKQPTISVAQVVHRQGLAKLDIRRLSPHVTLARKASNWTQALKTEELDFGDMPVSCITLFESRSGHYLPLGTVDLAAEAGDRVINLAADTDDVSGLALTYLPPALHP